jgi:hypothetical protein
MPRVVRETPIWNTISNTTTPQRRASTVSSVRFPYKWIQIVRSRNGGGLDLVRRVCHAGGEVVERILLAVEFAEAEGKEDAAGERETGHERVVDDEVRVLGEGEESKPETANVRKSKVSREINTTWGQREQTYAEEMAVMKSWIDITIERIDLGASERTSGRYQRSGVKIRRRGKSCSLVKAYSSVVTEAKISERAMRT